MRVNPVIDTFKITTTLTRPANTTQYAVGDAITNSTSAPTALTFSNVGVKVGETVTITEVTITSDVLGATGAPEVNFWTFNGTPTASNDNTAFTLTDAHNNLCEGVIPVTETYTAANNTRVENYNFEKQVVLGSTTRDLFALLESRNTYTPASGEVFTITIKGKRYA